MIMPQIEILEPGLMTTVQDAGRWGHQRAGVPVCGVRDQLARRFANTLVGNHPNTPVLEANMIGPSFQVLQAPVLVALVGSTQAVLEIGPHSIPAQQSVMVYPGERVRVSPWGDSACLTLAFGGGIDVPLVLGSASTYLRGQIGGFEGRKLEGGDVLTLKPSPSSVERHCPFAIPYGTGALPVVLGPQDDHFPAQAIDVLTTQPYVVTNDCDRMGTRFEGPPLPRQGGFNIVSDANAPGSIQIPGSHMPIIMGPDRGTVGGYTKIGTLATTAMSRFGRMKPRDQVRFALQTPHDALAGLRAKEVQVRRMLMQLVPKAAR